MPSPFVSKLEFGGIRLSRFVGEENVERAPSASVRLEERSVAEHLGCFFALRQNPLPIGPKPEPLTDRVRSDWLQTGTAGLKTRRTDAQTG